MKIANSSKTPLLKTIYFAIISFFTMILNRICNFSILSGWGVINAMHTIIHKGSFVLHYDGDLIDKNEAVKREEKYNKKNSGSYMFYFKHAGQEMWYVVFL